MLTMWIESRPSGKALCRARRATSRGDQMPTSEFMNVRETAKQLGVHENTVRNWEKSGILRGFKTPGLGIPPLSP